MTIGESREEHNGRRCGHEDHLPRSPLSPTRLLLLRGIRRPTGQPARLVAERPRNRPIPIRRQSLFHAHLPHRDHPFGGLADGSLQDDLEMTVNSYPECFEDRLRTGSSRGGKPPKDLQMREA